MAWGESWWQRGVFYQIYPRSFMDCNGDGVGDLAGVTHRLEYLTWLGVDAIWISPFFTSPMADFGYDISDHEDVDPLFGTIEHFDLLLERAHALGLRVVLDFVPNHTSDRHPWFVASRSSRTHPMREWYLWKDAPPGGGLPNNWLSAFGGPAWTWDPGTRQYYYHSYLPQQPDLNWRNPEVQRAMHGVLRFWLDRGVDGFRLDAVRKVMKDLQWRDNPPNPDWRPHQGPYKGQLTTYSASQPEAHEVIRGIRGVIDGYPDRVLIGELYEPLEKLVTYYGEGGCECHLPFNFHLISTPWRAADIAALVARYEQLLPVWGWPDWVLGNHDKHRVASRVGEQQARVAMMLLLTLRGTPTIYQGDELGLCDVPIGPDQVQDPWEKNVPGLGLGRDPERSPMPWDAGRHAGFSQVAPWLPLEAQYAKRCVAVERDDPGSMLSLCRSLLRLRKAEPALARGAYAERAVEGSTFAYERRHDGRVLLSVLNFGAEPQRAPSGLQGSVLVSTHQHLQGEALTGEWELPGNGGVLIDPA